MIFFRILSILKYSFFFLMFGIIQVFASNNYSQTTKLTINMQDATVAQVISHIENISQFYFTYNTREINPNRKVSVSVQEKDIDDALTQLFAGENVHYIISDKHVVLFKDNEQTYQGSTQQGIAITGKVTDEFGEPMPGVNVMVKGTTIGFVADLNGNYWVTVPAQNTVLVFSFVGFIAQEITVGNQTTINVVMIEDSRQMEELVVVGYGTQRKVNLTGSVASLAGDELSGMPAPSTEILLQGKIPGVAITSTSGQPGNEGISIRIRGVGTMNNSNPMILIDGLEASMSDVNPSDIENISVLKDAAAAAIYGTRAANGVILITTKRGKVGKPTLSYNGYFGFQETIRRMEPLSSAEFAEFFNEGRKNEGNTPTYTPEDIAKYRNGTDPDNFPDTYWLDLLLQGNGFTQNHNISLIGGTENFRYTTSLAYYNQEGLVKNTKHDRYTVRINMDSNINKWLSFGINSSMSHRQIDAPTSPYGGLGEFFRQANRIPNTFVNKYSDGTYGRHIDGNPIAWAEAGGEANSGDSRILGSVFGEIKIIDGLTLKGTAGINFNLLDRKTHIRELTYGDGTVQGPNSVEDYLNREKTITLQGLMTYEKKFGNHYIKGLFGVSRESYSMHRTEAYRKNFPSNDLTELNAGSADGWTNNGTSSDANLGSYFGRINYDYAGKYLLEFNVRRDGSSKFASGNRWGTFPSFSAGWRLSEEQFMKSIVWLDNLKLRGSWGKLGNHRINDYLYISTITLAQNYNFSGSIADGAAQTVANNPEISWEKTTELDLGLDADFMKGFLTVSFDYYNRYTDDILAVVPLTYIYGLDAPTSNSGAMRNRGIELSLGHSNKIGKVQYDVNIYITKNTNIVEKYPNPSKGTTIRMEGYPWDSFYGYECIGIFMTDEEALSSPVHSSLVRAGDLKFKDQNGDGKIDSDDRIVLGNTIPNYTYGFNIGARYQGFDFIAAFQGVADVYRTIDTEAMWGLYNGANARKRNLDRTLVENGVVTQVGYYPRTLINRSHNRDMSSFLALNASYLRLKNLQLGYTIPQSILSKVLLNRARIYISGQNLLTFTKFVKDVDPEVSSGNVSSNYPQVAIYTVGLDITF